MVRFIGTWITCLLLWGCAATSPDNNQQSSPDKQGSRYPLEVTTRSATTLKLRWPSMGTPETYTVDYLTGVAKCQDFPMHNDVLHVTGTTVQLTGLLPATRYHIHVHLLPYASNSTSSTVFITTLAAGSAEQPVTSADYESCTSGT